MFMLPVYVIGFDFSRVRFLREPRLLFFTFDLDSPLPPLSFLPRLFVAPSSGIVFNDFSRRSFPARTANRTPPPPGGVRPSMLRLDIIIKCQAVYVLTDISG
ncbi:hypothetical protein SpCBS45565_g07575 [Spizellomyces sp. 'palustris']|nr:hypothetical protein SpCBS45565_g07575 [Spizellomyces sp. 'palustris']